MVKILITGFKHSGTTLLHNLIKDHPQVGWIEFEEALIEYDKSPQWILAMAQNSGVNLKNEAWGEKLPWGTRENDWKAKRAIMFTKKWLHYFRKEARVLHILRHPLDVALSRYPSKSSVNNTKIDKKMLQYYLNSVPQYLGFIADQKYCATVVYEELLERPDIMLWNVFHFLNLDKNPNTIRNIIAHNNIDRSRAYAYKGKGIVYDFDYDKLVEGVERKL